MPSTSWKKAKDPLKTVISQCIKFASVNMR
jgi:hypothetical protein